MGDPIDAVYFVRHFTGSPQLHDRYTSELRYSLRSLANFTSLGRVIILGGRPKWLDVERCDWRPSPRGSDEYAVVKEWAAHKHVNTWAHWQRIAQLAGAGLLSERFAIFNDDHFVVRRTDDIPNYHRGDLTSWVAGLRFRGQGGTYAGTAQAMERAAAWVTEHFGVPLAEQVAYETHTPLLVHRDSFAQVFDLAGRTITQRVAKRSLYGNAVRLAATMMRDVKVGDGEQLSQIKALKPVFLSTADNSFWYQQVGRRLREQFPFPSPYELVA